LNDVLKTWWYRGVDGFSGPNISSLVCDAKRSAGDNLRRSVSARTGRMDQSSECKRPTQGNWLGILLVARIASVVARLVAHSGPCPATLAPGPRLWDLEFDSGPTGETCDRQATHSPQATCPGAERSPVSAPVLGTGDLMATGPSGRGSTVLRSKWNGTLTLARRRSATCYPTRRNVIQSCRCDPGHHLSHPHAFGIEPRREESSGRPLRCDPISGEHGWKETQLDPLSSCLMALQLGLASRR
jgi:hypothetical protein